MATVNTHYSKDKDGQWWHAFKDGRRTRAKTYECLECARMFPSWRPQRFCSVVCRSSAREVVHTKQRCVFCQKRFAPINKRHRYCSHGCAASAYHARQQITTDSGGRAIKNIENTRYRRDERGQWWYTPDGAGRTRAYLKECSECGELFLTNIFHQRQGTCSKSCGHRAFNKKNPGAWAGEKSGCWKGGVTRRHGYVMQFAPDHHSVVGTTRRYVLQHRIVMESKIGRPLRPHERVHHLNGVKHDNRPENLELWAISHPSGQRVHEQKHCPTCRCVETQT
jgi:hypothetical protein